jgi:antitoxin MazE
VKTTSSIRKWGNSLAIRIPAAVVQDLALTENSTVQIVSNGVVATLQPQKRKQATLDELVAAITPQNLHQEIDWGCPVGKEVW